MWLLGFLGESPLGLDLLGQSLSVIFLGRVGYGFCLGLGCLELCAFMSCRCLLGPCAWLRTTAPHAWRLQLSEPGGLPLRLPWPPGAPSPYPWTLGAWPLPLPLLPPLFWPQTHPLRLAASAVAVSLASFGRLSAGNGPGCGRVCTCRLNIK